MYVCMYKCIQGSLDGVLKLWHGHVQAFSSICLAGCVTGGSIQVTHALTIATFGARPVLVLVGLRSFCIPPRIAKWCPVALSVAGQPIPIPPDHVNSWRSATQLTLVASSTHKLLSPTNLHIAHGDTEASSGQGQITRLIEPITHPYDHNHICTRGNKATYASAFVSHAQTNRSVYLRATRMSSLIFFA